MNLLRKKNETEVQFDSLKTLKSLAILKAKSLKLGDGNKYLYPKIEVLEVLVNKTRYNFRDTMHVANYNWKPGIPQNKECTIYLTSWPYGSNEMNEKNEWMLIEGDGEYACKCE